MNQDQVSRARGYPKPGEKNLLLWEKSIQLSVEIFKIADRIPEELGINLGGEMRVAALTVPSRVARTESGISAKQYLHGLALARGALLELQTDLTLCAELGYASELEIRRIGGQIDQLARMLAIVMKRIRRSLNAGSLQAISDEIAALIEEEKVTSVA